MSRDVTLVPGRENRLAVRKVLIEGGTPDSRFLGDLRHSHCAKPMLGNSGGGGLHDRIVNLAAMGLDGLTPELRHGPTIRVAY